MEEKFSEANDFISRMEEYVSTRIELAKLTVVDKASTLLSDIMSSLIIGVTLVITLIFLSIAAGLAISSYYGNVWIGFVILAGFYLLLSSIIIIFKKRIIEYPLSNLFIKTMLEDSPDDTK